MLNFIVALLCALFGSDADSERLRASAPSYLTRDSAVAHLWSARVAAWRAGADANVLLAVAWHESRYTSNVATREPGERWSCGVMTPIPHAERCVDRALVDQYLEGAEHLAHDWHGSLLGYAGLGGACARGRGPVMVERGGRSVDLCDFERDMYERARAIRGAATHKRGQT